jgi:hypothetical protein|nr:MAG TPA: tail spike protein [Caudoviricetes sp.]
MAVENIKNILRDLIFKGAGQAPVTATGTTTARKIKDRFSDEVNVRDFGAKGDGVTDDTAVMQIAIDILAKLGGGSLYFPPGVFLQSSTLTLRSKVILRGAGRRLTTIKKTAGFNGDALVSENFDELASVDDQIHNSKMPFDFGAEQLTFQGQYLANDVTSENNSYINTSGGGIKIIGARVTLDCDVLNNAGVGVFLECTGTPDQSELSQYSRIRLNINTSKYENLIFNGPADIFVDEIFAGNAGVRISYDELEASPTFGTSNGGVCDNVVFKNGCEIGFIHAWGTYQGVGIRVLGGRLNADFMITESNRFGNLRYEGQSYGTISRLLTHGGGGGLPLGEALIAAGQTFPDVLLNSSNSRGVSIASTYLYSRGNVDHGQDKVVVKGNFNCLSDVHITGNACAGDGVVVEGAYNVIDNAFINNLTGAGVTRKASSASSMNRINAMVASCATAFKSEGTPRVEDIHVAFALKDGGEPFSGDQKTFGSEQHWEIHGTVGTVSKGTKFVTRVAFNPTLTTEQEISVAHNLIYAANVSNVLISIQDTGISMATAEFAYCYVSAITDETISIKLKLKTANATNTSPYVTVSVEI